MHRSLLTKVLFAYCFIGVPQLTLRFEDPPDGPKRIFKDEFIENLVGDWKLTRKIRGKEVQNTVKAEWVLNHQFLQLHMKDVAVHYGPARAGEELEPLLGLHRHEELDEHDVVVAGLHHRLGEHVEDLARHFARAEEWERAVQYHAEAGRKAGALCANMQAVGWFERTLELPCDLEGAEVKVEGREGIPTGRAARPVRGGATLPRGEHPGPAR